MIDFVEEAASRIDLGSEQLTASQLLERFLFPPAQQHSPISKLSGGERRRLTLCRLLIQAPNVLLLDEPLSALDSETREEIQTLLRTLTENTGVTTLHITHNAAEATALADRRFHISAGQVIEEAVNPEQQPKPSDSSSG